MANVLTDLAGDIYTAADIVGRELTGASSSVMRNTSNERASIGDPHSFILHPASDRY